MHAQGFLTVKDLSSYLGVSPCTVYRWVENAEVPYIKRRGLGLRFRRDDIDAWLKKSSSRPSPVLDEILKIDLSLEAYDKLFLKGGVKVSPKGKTWNYPFGSVYLRLTKSGRDRWYIYYRVKGKRVRECVRHALGRVDALKVLSVRIADAFSREYGFKKKRENIRFVDFLDEVIRSFDADGKRSVSRDNYSAVHLKSFRDFRDVNLSEITPQSVVNYKAHRKIEGALPGTINRELALLRSVLYKAVEWGKLESYPLPKKRLLLKEDNQRDRILTVEEIDKLLDAAKPHLRPILTLLLGTGMRRTEALSLQWENVDFLRGFIYVGSRDTKSGRSRTIPMSGLVHQMLKDLHKGTNHGFVFVNPETKDRFRDISESFKTACDDADIKGVTLHTLRHTAGSQMVESGIDLPTVAKILGHSTIQMTMRYCHPTPENMRRAVEALAQLCPHSVPGENCIPHEASVSHSLAVS
jgi:excisionase family DNA binding protein